MFTKATILSARLGDVSPLGAAASRLWAAAGVSSDLTGGVKAPCPKPKLPKTEADTVPTRRAFRSKSVKLLDITSNVKTHHHTS